MPPNHSVKPLIDGSEIYQSLLTDLKKAKRRIYIAIWMLSDDFVIDYSTNPPLTLSQFCKNTLANNSNLNIYLLRWEPPLSGFFGMFLSSGFGYTFNPNKWRRSIDRHRFHHQHQPNLLLGSHHEKFVISDGDGTGASLHCMGLNFLDEYWDDADHPFPLPYGIKRSWHDTAIKVKGPIIKDFEDEFRRRWLDVSGQNLISNRFDASPRGNISAQALIHKENTKRGDIHDWHITAINNARNFIYFENQYFDDDEIADALITRYLDLEIRGIKIPMVIVLPHTKVLSPFLGPGTKKEIFRMRLSTANLIWVDRRRRPIRRPRGGWSITRKFSWVGVGPRRIRGLFYELRNISNGRLITRFKKLKRTSGGIRFYTMATPNTLKRGKFRWIYLHSKLTIIDNKYTIGSSNIAKGWSFDRDSEANVAITSSGEVRRLISKLWVPMLSNQSSIPTSIDDWFIIFERTSRENLRRENSNPVRPPCGMLCEFPF